MLKRAAAKSWPRPRGPMSGGGYDVLDRDGVNPDDDAD